MHLEGEGRVAKGRPRPEVHHAAERSERGLHEDRVYTRWREKFALRCQSNVQGGKAKQAAALVASDYSARNGIASAKQPLSARQIAVGYRATDGAGRDRQAIHRYGFDDTDIESVTLAEAAEDIDVTGAASPKTVIVTVYELAQTEALEEYALDEFGCIERGERGGKWKYSDVRQTAFGNGFELLWSCREQERRGGGIEDFEGMRLEGHEEARERARRSARHGSGE